MQRTGSGVNFARYALGEMTILALRDGHVDMPPSRLRQEGDRPFGTDLPASVQLVGGKLRLSVNAFLVIARGRHILIDTGAGNAWEPSMGLLPAALEEAGVAREAIGTVAFTHTHLDHVAGLVAADGTESFPPATRLLVPEAELPLFRRSGRLARFRARCTGFAPGFELAEGITALAAHGHEVGHTAFEVTSGGETLLIWGDIVHVPSMQFSRPELTWEFDADQAQARAARREMLARAARPGCCVAGAHLDFPGIGSVAAEGEGYAFTPL
ncbi:MBL fold metallo-hydrolase [Siccirubricoccus phaeus]|uniref:MBL fold metallo-hydrolase n=1 Tax=Siccirubricoccus phaeus TaxID=2595053 RepID=UPI0011F22D01|nr:MBL fold metallo-hydrolase [Siccirubricoccus phaeus]